MNTAPVGGYEVQPAAITGAAGCFDAEAEAVVQAMFQLRQQLGTLGQPWGADAVGSRFGSQYTPPAEIVLANVEALAIGMARIAAALRAVAGAYVRGEDDLLAPITELEESVA